MECPSPGDTVHIKATAASMLAGSEGTVCQVRFRPAGVWTAVQVLAGGQRRWFDRAEIDQVRPERNPFRLRTAPHQPQAPGKLFAILAREAATGVIFRRGPSDWVQLIKWDQAADSFEPGQWFHGRLYEHRGDLSPDGTKLIYCAAKPPRVSLPNDGGYSYAWTAISRPPFLTALALWPKGCCGTYFGGGLFVTDRHVWLNHPGCEAEPHPAHQPPSQLKVTLRTFDPSYPAGYYQRLQRDGSKVDPAWWQQQKPSGFVGAPRAWLEKAHPRLPFGLVMEADILYGSDSPAFALQDEQRGELTPLAGATWADWDQRGRLAYAAGGKLFALEVQESGVSQPIELADFTQSRPQPVEIPRLGARVVNGAGPHPP